ncbi:MAG: DNA-directed RNA polymerase [Desulfurococcales archaeon ex4484_204]|nr:MAG: DNA-directed RNA polymerase [Desulfurococcales archaeon ex4484_204]
MFRLVEIEDIVRIPPDRFGENLEGIAYELLREKYVGRVNQLMGLVIAIADIKVNPEGMIIPGDGATYHEVRAKLVTFYPISNEVVEGEVVDIKKIGIFVNIGPIDAFVHVSQIMDDKMIYDEVRGVLIGEETKVTISRGDIVRGRIVNVTLAPPATIRVGMTLRQPSLGKVRP